MAAGCRHGGLASAPVASPDPERVVAFDAASDGRAAWVQTWSEGDDIVALLDGDGRIVKEIAADLRSSGTAAWRTIGDRRALCYVLPGGVAWLDLDTLVTHEVMIPGTAAATHSFWFFGWMSDGRLLLNAWRYNAPADEPRRFDLVDLETGIVERPELPPEVGALDGGSGVRLVNGRELAWFLPGSATRAPSLRTFDLLEGELATLALPREVERCAIPESGDDLLLITKSIEDGQVVTRVVARRRSVDSERVLLGPPDLPVMRATSAERGMGPYVSTWDVDGGEWFRVMGDMDFGSGGARQWIAMPAAGRALALERLTHDPVADSSLQFRFQRMPDGKRLLSTESLQGRGTPMRVETFDVSDDGLTLRAAHEVDGHSFTWFGADRLLYEHILWASDEPRGTELRALDLATGVSRRFFTGERVARP